MILILDVVNCTRSFSDTESDNNDKQKSKKLNLNDSISVSTRCYGEPSLPKWQQLFHY